MSKFHDKLDEAVSSIVNPGSNLMDKYNLNGDDKFRYSMLSRLQSDCKYVLGEGNGNLRHLWVKDDPKTHCALMREIYNSLPEKPDWITLDDIDNYEKELTKTKVTEATSNAEWEAICKTFCEKIGAELLFVNDDNFGYQTKDGQLVHMYANELEQYLKTNKLNESEYDTSDIGNPLIQDIIDMMSDFGWKVSKSDNGVIVDDGAFKVKVSFEEITNESELDESFKMKDPKDRRKSVIVTDEVDELIKSPEFTKILDSIKKDGGKVTYGIDYDYYLNYYLDTLDFDDYKKLGIMRSLGLNTDDTSMGDLHGHGYPSHEGIIKINNIPIKVSMSYGLRFITLTILQKLKEVPDMADEDIDGILRSFGPDEDPIIYNYGKAEKDYRQAVANYAKDSNDKNYKQMMKAKLNLQKKQKRWLYR